MQLSAESLRLSYQVSTDPMILSDIFHSSVSIAVWKRQIAPLVERYYEDVKGDLVLGIRHVLHIDSLKQSLNDLLPDGAGKTEAIDDLYLLSDMLTCLFDCQSVGLRLAMVKEAMCPRFHVDNIPVRLITTYLGPGTECLQNEFADVSKLGRGAQGKPDNQSGLYSQNSAIKQLSTFDVALLKGSAWGEDHLPAIHRSCQLQPHQNRIVMTLDPV